MLVRGFNLPLELLGFRQAFLAGDLLQFIRKHKGVAGRPVLGKTF